MANTKVRTGKAKGRRLQKRIAQYISDLTGVPCGKDEDIEAREMGQAGVDVKLYGKARKLFPFGVECKNQENWSIGSYIDQAREYASKDKFPYWLLFVAKNHFPAIVVFPLKYKFEIFDILVNYQELNITERKVWKLEKEVRELRKKHHGHWIIYAVNYKETQEDMYAIMDAKEFFEEYERSTFFYFLGKEKK